MQMQIPVPEGAPLLAAALAGAALGAFFFGGLWWTVRRALASPHPALWQFGSLLLRTGVTLLGVHLAGGGQWPRLLACLAGFVVARGVVLRVTRSPAAARGGHPAQEDGHAPQP